MCLVDNRSGAVELVGFDPEHFDATSRQPLPLRRVTTADRTAIDGARPQFQRSDRCVVEPECFFDQPSSLIVLTLQVTIVVVDELGEAVAQFTHTLAPSVVGVTRQQRGGLRLAEPIARAVGRMDCTDRTNPVCSITSSVVGPGDATELSQAIALTVGSVAG